MSLREPLSRSLIVGGVLVLAGAAFCCVERSAQPASPAGAATSQGDEASPAPALPGETDGPRLEGVAVEAPGEPEPSSSVTPSANGDTATPAPTGVVAHPAAQVMRDREAPDRNLLAEVERATKAAPPKAIFELLALRKRGADRAELERFIASELGGQLPLQLAARRWLREVSEPEGVAPAPADTSSFGSGGNPARVQPIVPR